VLRAAHGLLSSVGDDRITEQPQTTAVMTTRTTPVKAMTTTLTKTTETETQTEMAQAFMST
jgi:hypothetical protein